MLAPSSVSPALRRGSADTSPLRRCCRRCPPCAPAARSSQSPLKKAVSPKAAPTRQPLMLTPTSGAARRPCARPPSCRARPRACAQPKIAEVEGLAGADADARELCADLLFVRLGGRELQREIEIFEEVLLDELLVDLRRNRSPARRGGARLLEDRPTAAAPCSRPGPSSRCPCRPGRRAGCGRCSENCVVERKTFLIPAGVSPFQSGPTTISRRRRCRWRGCRYSRSCRCCRRTADRVVALRIDRRDRNHHRFGAQVHPQHRIGRVAVGRDDAVSL